ncbi:glycoside hydrolase [Lojkania enalia]|uniref:Glycoside hydrolase n=1 Tax=Lojkania enalia TaxID=147567 RepID=A0A9P4K726_9PLEO|nr:glycoside hydrolase [Didymosphaeria enalia]
MGYTPPLSCISLPLCYLFLFLFLSYVHIEASPLKLTREATTVSSRQRLSVSNDWKFFRSETNPDQISYDKRPNLPSTSNTESLKAWILPSGNQFIKDPAKRYSRPTSSQRTNVTYAQNGFDDSKWETVSLPHDWAIQGPFYRDDSVPVKGGMGRLPIHGVGWYRRKLSVSVEDKSKLMYLDIDGAMSYAMVWVNEILVGGWPYGYNSFRLDLTPYLKEGHDNLLAIRLDNPTDSSRWYPGGGIYRNVWITKVEKVHVGQWGTFITSRNVSKKSATIDFIIQVENEDDIAQEVNVATDVHVFDAKSGRAGEKVAEFPRAVVTIGGNQHLQAKGTTELNNPKLWGPYSTQHPNLYIAITRLSANNETFDTYETQFGIRSITYDGDKGLLVNDEHVEIQGVNQHHDLGALGAAFNIRAAERQLEVLQELGCNAIRMSHNPPSPELLELTDRMGFLVVDEIFDVWERSKTSADFSLIFPEWHEPDLRAFIRRDRNHPSIIVWSVGNEVGEQYTDVSGASIAQTLNDMVYEEDPTRPTTASMNYAKPYMPFPRALDILSLNYQGEGIRDAPAYSHLSGIKTPPLYPDFHRTFPEKLLWASESAASLSTRGTYIFPVTRGISAPVNDTSGGNSKYLHVSSYELYSADFGASPDKVFSAQDHNPFVAGEFVWSGWDYLGEPTPYYSARSSYFGIIDLAGFKKDRFYLYQARWRPDLRMAHILPHWTWPGREGKVTPVHVFSSADEAELFINGKPQGKKKKGNYEYRFRWDDVLYEAGEISVVTYKKGSEWAKASVRTAGPAMGLRVNADRMDINGDGKDLAYLTVEIVDEEGNIVPEADNEVMFSVSGPGEIVATDNGNPTDFTSFISQTRKAFSGKVLVIVRASPGEAGEITVMASAVELKSVKVKIAAH